MASTSASKPKKAQPSAEDKSAFGPIAERFRRAGDLERAVSLCREGLHKFPDNISARVTLGWALLELGKFDDARVELEQVLRRRPDNLAAIRALAELHDRAEHTMNLPMDGPGQWPPSADEVDEMAGGMVADHFRSVSADESLDAAPEESVAGPAVVPPAELGLAMWSALPATESPAEAEPKHISISPSSVPDDLDAGPAPSALADVDIAALLAEVESLEALADVSPVTRGETARTHAPATTLMDAAFAPDPNIETAIELDAEPDLAVFNEFQPPVTSAVEERADLTSGSVDLGAVEGIEAVEELTAGIVDAPVVEDLTAEPVDLGAAEELTAGPVFELEHVSAAALEAAEPMASALSAENDLETTPGVVFDADAQPILRFDLEPVAEPVVVEAPVLAAVAPYEPPAAAAIALVATEAVVESAVISSVQARIAEVVAMARHVEPTPSVPNASIIHLERFLSQVQSRRRTMAESVA
jgi:tetratricopeptide (TPR) repeat protein